jgi:hypothetical protein
MARSSATRDDERRVADPIRIEQPLQPVRAGGPGRPLGLTVALVAILAALVWQPWGGTAAPVAHATQTAIAAARAPSASADPTTSAPASPAPTPRVARPSVAPASSGPPITDTYLSIGDNDWSVVALMAPEKLAAAQQPWVPDATGELQAPGGSLLVLQQGPNYTRTPVDDPGDPAAICQTRPGFRDYAAAHFPRDRVAYLGVTFPGMNPKARVSGVILDQRGLALKRLSVVTVRLSGMTEGHRYTVPTAGSGAAALFALSPRAIMPVAAYRFDIQTPGVTGHRYLYACVDP